ncbi:hypothetical protein [Kribbella catacumbae]|uniref:hypothetical protein n=1 Tax=Kribbella catacumbae TaxID=460086 RepID=UPI0003664BE2|nr:hypothetical protein [Kribbella catacumbae]
MVVLLAIEPLEGLIAIGREDQVELRIGSGQVDRIARRRQCLRSSQAGVDDVDDKPGEGLLAFSRPAPLQPSDYPVVQVRAGD